jgi:C-terminal processing protease CtpA/Prc
VRALERGGAVAEPAVAEPPFERPPPEPRPKAQVPKVEIIFDGIERRLRFVTPLSMDTHALCISPDSRDLVFSAVVAGKSNLWTVPLDEPRQEQPPRQLTFGTSRKGAAQFAPEGKSFYFIDNGQIAIRKFPSGDQIGLPISADVTIDFGQEKRQMFDECWRLLRDYFYDPTFRGLDWSEARRQFAPLAAGAQTYGELLAVLNLMVGELRASHLGAFPSNGGPSQQGYLGLLFDAREQARSGRLVIAAVVPDSPAALAGDGRPPAAGDELLAINRIELAPDTSLDALLQRTAGRRVLLRIMTPGGEQRELAVRPIGAGYYRYLRYRAWVYDNEAYVHRVSGGRLGYVHIRAMDESSYQQFLIDLDSEAYSKAGVVIDARFNGGGYMGTFILDILARRSVLLSTFRDRPPIDAGYFHGNRVLNKPTILVINEGSGSNTEMFAESYRRLGLGKVVGRPSAGAVIGTIDHKLLDDTTFRLPRIKIATPEGEDLEGTGRTVDIDVSLPVGEPARGADRQLDAAVAALLAQVDGAD